MTMSRSKRPPLIPDPEQDETAGSKVGFGLGSIDVDIEMPDVLEPPETGTAAGDDPLGIKEEQD